MDDKTTQEIRKLIAEIAQQEFDKVMPNIEMTYDGVIDYYTDDEGTEDINRLVVKVKGEQYDLDSPDGNLGVCIRNPYSLPLAKGKVVRVNAKGGNLHNAYINVSYDKKST